MKKNKKIIISVISSVLILALGIFIYYRFFYDANKLNLTEKEWLNNHKTNIISFNVLNDINILGKDGEGLFYDFLNGLQETDGIKINPNIVNRTVTTGLGFAVNKKTTNNDLLFYKDHYVILSKNYLDIKELTDFNGKNIGALSDDISRINANYKAHISYTVIESKYALIEALKNDKVPYILVPLTEYIDDILTNNFQIIYHLDDLTNYYYLHLGEDKTLNSIIRKYYNNWIKKDNLNSYYKNTYNLFIKKLNITEIEADTLTNRSYVYGFVNNAPYNILNSSKYGGIIISYLEDFSKFSGVDFTFTKFKNNDELVKAFNKSKVDLIFNNNSFITEKYEINTNITDKYYIISTLNNSFKVSNINDLNNVTIYVLKDSKLAQNLISYSNITLKYAKNEKELLKHTKNNNLIALDSNTYNYYVNNKINNYQIVYTGYNSNYSFKYQNNNDTFYKLFNNYIKYLSNYELTNQGIISYQNALKSGRIISLIAKYFLIIVALTTVISIVIIRSKKRIKLNTHIRKDEKLKFIDMLTSLKNRNYLNEKISVWNQNTIYPQAIIVIDLNNIKYLNDTFGSKEGDKQIMAAANILHQTQLDNTEIMRTDGNEFMVYLVGYTEKQVINYLKKLVKDFNKLPYEYGAAFGFSMIVDDLKLIDDAINEATIQMRENKEIENEKNEDEN